VSEEGWSRENEILKKEIEGLKREIHEIKNEIDLDEYDLDRYKTGVQALITQHGMVFTFIMVLGVVFVIMISKGTQAYINKELEFFGTFFVIIGVLFEAIKFKSPFYRRVRRSGMWFLVAGLYAELLNVMSIQDKNISQQTNTYFGRGLMIAFPIIIICNLFYTWYHKNTFKSKN
jgi:hypothetical protein